MPVCTECGRDAMRIQRTSLQKIVDRAIFKCSHCGAKISVRRSFFLLFRKYAECPRCGTVDLMKRKQADRIDSMTANPLRRLLVLVGAPLYHCTFCRLQFRDWRSLSPNRRRRRSSDL